METLGRLAGLVLMIIEATAKVKARTSLQVRRRKIITIMATRTDTTASYGES